MPGYSKTFTAAMENRKKLRFVAPPTSCQDRDAEHSDFLESYLPGYFSLVHKPSRHTALSCHTAAAIVWQSDCFTKACYAASKDELVNYVSGAHLSTQQEGGP